MRSRRILDREKTHKLKYLRAHYFFKNCTPGITNITSLVFPIEKTWIWPRGEQWRTLVWCVTSTVQQWNSLSLFTNKKKPRILSRKETRDRIRGFFLFVKRLTSFHCCTVDVTHTRVRHCSPLGQIQVFSVRNTRDVIYSTSPKPRPYAIFDLWYWRLDLPIITWTTAHR